MKFENSGKNKKIVPSLPSERCAALTMATIRLGDALNTAQTSEKTHPKLAARLAPLRAADPAAFAAELLGLYRHVMTVNKVRRRRAPCAALSFFQREPAVERLAKFVAAAATWHGAGAGEGDAAAVEACEALLRGALPLCVAADKAVRFRAAQLVSHVLAALGEDDDLDDGLLDEVVDAMTARLRDKHPAARAAAATALARLQDPGEAGDYSGCGVASSLLEALDTDKHKDVRKAALCSLALSSHTLPAVIARTRDTVEEVRRAAFGVVASKVKLGELKVSWRATLLHRGLADRAPTVRAAAVTMLGKWMEGARGCFPVACAPSLFPPVC